MKIIFLGDVMLGRLVNEKLKYEPFDYLWGDTLSILGEADLRICNLECVISDSGTPWSVTPKPFFFRSDGKNIECLRLAKINLVSIANNHVLDYEKIALKDMIRILDNAGIRHAGSGINLAEAQKPAMFKIMDRKIGFISFTDNEREWEAGDKKAGVYYVPIDFEDRRAMRLFEIVGKMKNQCDIIIISVHWGSNWGYRPEDNQIEFAHALIDAGADVIFGHSPHVFRGVEIYGKKPILYSAGNFIDDYAVDEIERNDQSFIFEIEMKKNIFERAVLYPTVIRDFQVRLAEQFEAEQINKKMEKLCAEFKMAAIWYKSENCLIIENLPR